MPFEELLVYLASQGDSIARREAGVIQTTRGQRYIQSFQGYRYVGNAYVGHYIWSRV